MMTERTRERLLDLRDHAVTTAGIAAMLVLLWFSLPHARENAPSTEPALHPAALDLSADFSQPLPSAVPLPAARPLPGDELPGTGARKIADLRPGHRVLALNPDLDGTRGREQPTRVTPRTHRLITMRLDHALPDGTIDDVHIQTLQPAWWIVNNTVQVGSSAPVPLDLEELGVSGEALVTAIDACPPIEDGPGAVVLTTVNHLSDAVYELTVKDPDGRTETLTPTVNQPFYCLDENDWLPTEELLEGDRLRTHTGEVTVTRLKTIPGRHRVYNLTVETEHAYHVSALGVVSHNTCDPWRRKSVRRVTNAGPGEVGHHIFPIGRYSNRDAKTRRAIARGRALFEKYGIKPNGSANAVAVVGNQHAKLHTNEYIRTVVARLRRADTRGGEAAVLDELGKIAEQLRNFGKL